MKKLLLAFILSFICTWSFGQVYTTGPTAYNIIAPVSPVNLSGGDDIVTANVPIGFSFPFYCTNYTTCHISTNGLLSFNAGIGSGCCSGGALPNNVFASTIIAWSWDDMYTTGSVAYRYFVSGVAPNRIFCIDYFSIGYCCSPANNATVQIQLFETTGEIRMMSTNNIHAGRTATMGIQSGALGTVVAGRNAASWSSAANEGISFMPPPGAPPTISSFTPNSACAGAGTSVVITGTGFTNANAVTIGGTPVQSFVINNANQITAIVGAGTTGLIAVTAPCAGTGVSSSIFTVNTVAITTSTPNPVICAGGSANISVTGNGISYTWNPGGLVGANQTVTPPTSTVYTVTATTAAGCTGTSTVAISVSPMQAQPNPVTATPNLLCGGGTSQLSGTGTPGSTINWYSAAVGGTLLGSSPSGANFPVSPAVTTTYYAEAYSNIVGSQTFTYTGAMQNFTVPAGITSITINAKGAQGGAGGSSPAGSGGLGANMTGTFNVTPGQQLKVMVGQMGGGSPASPGAGGGGGTFVTDLANTPMIAAGGGGGRHGTLTPVGIDAVVTNNGLNGYSTPAGYPSNFGIGGVGGNGATNQNACSGNGGGLLTNGSANGGCCNTQFGLSFTNNGTGGPSCTGNVDLGGYGGGGGGGNNGAGGGGGYSGGGGSYHTPTNGGGGGSYNIGTSPINLVNNTGNGQVVITWSITTCPSSPRIPITVNVHPAPPVVTAVPASITVCEGTPVTLAGSSAPIVPFTWSGGVIDNVPFTPLTTTTYTVTGTDGNGCTGTATAVVTVNPVNTGTGSASPLTICLGSTTTITGAATPSCTGNISDFAGYYAPANWAFSVTNSNGTVNAAGAPANIIISSGTNLSGTPGVTKYSRTVGCNGNVTFNWTYNHADAFGSIFDYPRYTINGGAPVVFSAFIIGGGNVQNGSQSIPVSVGDVLELQMYTIDNDNIAGFVTINTFSAPNLGYTGTVSIWDAAVGGNNLGASPAVVTPATAGTVNYYVEVTSDGPGNCVNPTRVAVPVTVNSFPNLTASASPAAICPGGSSTLSGANGVSYVWNPGALPGSPTVTPAATTTYTVTGTAANGCTTTSNVTVTVNTLPTVTASPVTQTVCENGMATISGGGAATYTWTGGITDATPFMVVAASNYTVTGTDANGCSNTATAEVLMNAAPVITAGATPNTTCDQTTVTPSASGAGTIVWSGGLTNNVPFVAVATTTYTVTGTDGLGCSASTTVLVTVNPMSGILAPATSNQAQDHGDDFDINYYAANCDLIATVDDGAGGNVLGLTTSTVNVDATAGFHNGQPFVRRWYQITPTNNGSADVVLYINQSDFDDYNAAVALPYLPLPTSGNNADPNIGNIRITKNADAGLGNSPVVITPTANWNGTYWELSFNTPSFSQFRVHSVNPGNVPLPATVTSFSGLKLESSDKLSWTTSSEQNNAYFTLQHSTDGTNFTTIAKVNSKAQNGNSATELNYSSIHATPSLGHNYYRLQQTDLDNKLSVHAQIVDLIWGTNGSTVSIYPNPTRDILNIDLYAATAQNTTVKLLDMSGRVIKQIQAKSAVGMNNIKLSMGEIASGVYTVQVYENNQLSHTGKVKKN